MMIETTIRRIAILALGAAVAYGAYRLAPESVTADAARLAERMEQYIELRRADDQVAIYEMMDPEQRKLKDLPTFLKFYGTGVLRVIEMSYDDVRIDHESDPEGARARVHLTSTVRLVREKLPKPFNNLDEEHPEHLRQTGEDELDWVWREDDWYLRMQREFITGVAADGRKIQGVDPSSFR